MKKVKNLNNITLSLMIFLLVSIYVCFFWHTWNYVYKNEIVAPFYEKGAMLFMLTYIILFIIFSSIYGGCKVGYLKVFDIIYSQTLAVVLTNFVIYIQISLLTKKLVNPYSLLIMTVMEFIVLVIWSLLADAVYFKLCSPVKIIVVYSNNTYLNLIQKMKKYDRKFKICKSISINEGLEKIMSIICDYEALLICDVDSSDRNKLIKLCFSKSIKVYMTPKISDIIIGGSEKFHIFDTPLLVSNKFGLNNYQKFTKRIIDIVISSLSLILIFPIMLIISLLIKLYDGGPIFFKQKRVTINNMEFYIYKFRSMIVDAEKDGVARLASKNDDRITPIGKIIRKTRIDELPQLINILLGNMSVVGPRPERPEIVEQYVESMPEFEFRTKVKAGLTGYAQIIGKYNTTSYDKLKLDLMYIENYSLILDIKLILLTIKILFLSDSSEGIDDDEVIALSDK